MLKIAKSKYYYCYPLTYFRSLVSASTHLSEAMWFDANLTGEEAYFSSQSSLFSPVFILPLITIIRFGSIGHTKAISRFGELRTASRWWWWWLRQKSTMEANISREDSKSKAESSEDNGGEICYYINKTSLVITIRSPLPLAIELTLHLAGLKHSNMSSSIVRRHWSRHLQIGKLCPDHNIDTILAGTEWWYWLSNHHHHHHYDECTWSKGVDSRAVTLHTLSSFVSFVFQRNEKHNFGAMLLYVIKFRPALWRA